MTPSNYSNKPQYVVITLSEPIVMMTSGGFTGQISGDQVGGELPGELSDSLLAISSSPDKI